MNEIRKGRQTPTTSFTLPYTKTNGQQAVDLYNSTGRTAQEWQELLLFDILALNEDDLYTHTRYGYSVPRRNGKNEVVAMRELYGLAIGEHILHTAHRTTTAHTAWERLLDLVEKAGIEIESSFKAYGKESILLPTGGKIEFRTRTSKGGLGEGFDLLVIDEAQEYQDDQESTLKYVVSDSKNPQTLFLGTPPTAVSSGTVFVKLREDILSGKTSNAGWSEWSVSKLSDVNDRELWYETNPSLGTVLTERKIADEITTDDVDMNIQRLGLWLKTNLHSEISEQLWDELAITEDIEIQGGLFVGIKYGKDGNNVSMSVAVRTTDERIFIEAIDCRSIRNGNTWIIDFLKNCESVEKVAIDGAGQQDILRKEMLDFELKAPILPKVAEVSTAYAMFEQAMYSKEVCHNDQPSLRQSATNTEKRTIGSNGGFGYKSIKDDVDISILDSAILAHWLCSITKPKKKKQRIMY